MIYCYRTNHPQRLWLNTVPVTLLLLRVFEKSVTWELYVWAVLTQSLTWSESGGAWSWGGGDAEAARAFYVPLHLPVNLGLSTWSPFLGLNLGLFTPWWLQRFSVFWIELAKHLLITFHKTLYHWQMYSLLIKGYVRLILVSVGKYSNVIHHKRKIIFWAQIEK